jgi:Xaa-Pro aminopeptidase
MRPAGSRTKETAMPSLEFEPSEYQDRLARLRAAMARAGAEVMLIDDAEILAYFTGYERSVSYYRALIVPRDADPVMVLRSLDTAPFEEKSWIANHVGYPDTADAVRAVAEALTARGFAKAAIGLDLGSHAMTVDVFQRLTAALPNARIVPMNGVPWELRLIKSPAEIAYIRKAAEIADTTLVGIAEMARPGISEREVSAFAAKRFVELGGTPGHVGPITSGKGWGFLHGHLHDHPMEDGDILHLELVPRHSGYSARLMRSVIIGKATAPQRADANTLRDLQDAQIAAMVPGARAADVHAILAKGAIEKGLRDSYDNITGYTLGYYSQQPLRSSDFTRVFDATAQWALEPGMVFHIYTSAMGLAFSETVLVTENGPDRLTRIERKLFSTG